MLDSRREMQESDSATAPCRVSPRHASSMLGHTGVTAARLRQAAPRASRTSVLWPAHAMLKLLELDPVHPAVNGSILNLTLV
jgi:hypothetical protein